MGVSGGSSSRSLCHADPRVAPANYALALACRTPFAIAAAFSSACLATHSNSTSCGVAQAGQTATQWVSAGSGDRMRQCALQGARGEAGNTCIAFSILAWYVLRSSRKCAAFESLF